MARTRTDHATIPLVEVTRGEIIDTRHRGAVAAIHVAGDRLGSLGEPADMLAHWRSSAKPFQSMPLVSTGAASHFDLSAKDLAVCCGSHSGEPVHTDRVASLLSRVGLDPSHLACGQHPPIHGPSAEALVRRGTTPTSLHHNCSGLHAGMLILARHLDAPIDGYGEPNHPVQQEILAHVARFTNLEPAQIAKGVDGCSVPTFGITVDRMALAYARLMEPGAAGIREPLRSAAIAIRDSMAAHPLLVGGTGRLDTDLMKAGGGNLVSKGGAGGVQCVGLAGGIGVAIKIEDGEGGPLDLIRAKAVAMLAVLQQLGLVSQDRFEAVMAHAMPPVTTSRGRVVGEARPAFDLTGTARLHVAGDDAGPG